METETITVHKENSADIEVPVTADAESFALAGYTCKLLVKAEREDTTALIEETADVLEVIGDTVTFSLTALQLDQTVGDYWYEVVLIKDDFVRTIAQGIFIVLPSLNAQ